MASESSRNGMSDDMSQAGRSAGAETGRVGGVRTKGPTARERPGSSMHLGLSLGCEVRLRRAG